MSYILDALKKSEEERHQGQVPSLGGNSTLIHSSGAKSSVWPWVIVVLLLLNMFVIAYWLLSGNQSTDKSTNQSDVSSENFMEERSVSVTSKPKREPLIVHHKHNLRADPVIQAIEKSASPEYKLPDRTPPKILVSKASNIEHQVIQPELISPSVASIETPTQLQSDSVNEEPMLITPKSGARPYSGPAYDEVIEEVTIEEPDVSAVRHASDFPQSFQRRIPDMAFNSHIFTDTPDSRRVMINNIYLREGQAFSGLTVVQITEEGVVLSLDGQAFKVGVLRDWNSPR